MSEKHETNREMAERLAGDWEPLPLPVAFDQHAASLLRRIEDGGRRAELRGRYEDAAARLRGTYGIYSMYGIYAVRDLREVVEAQGVAT